MRQANKLTYLLTYNVVSHSVVGNEISALAITN